MSSLNELEAQDLAGERGLKGGGAIEGQATQANLQSVVPGGLQKHV